jgi:hypothetical protein
MQEKLLKIFQKFIFKNKLKNACMINLLLLPLLNNVR